MPALVRAAAHHRVRGFHERSEQLRLLRSPLRGGSRHATCALSTCGYSTCNAGFLDCNQDASDGCETSGTTCPAPKTVFITNATYSSNLGGYGGADANCAAAASAASLTGTFLAWISDGSVTPASRVAQSSIPYALVNGTIVANNWTGLISGNLRHAINLTETGVAPPAAQVGGVCDVWTGTSTGGNAQNGSCSSWSSTSSTGSAGNATCFARASAVAGVPRRFKYVGDATSIRRSEPLNRFLQRFAERPAASDGRIEPRPPRRAKATERYGLTPTPCAVMLFGAQTSILKSVNKMVACCAPVVRGLKVTVQPKPPTCVLGAFPDKEKALEVVEIGMVAMATLGPTTGTNAVG